MLGCCSRRPEENMVTLQGYKEIGPQLSLARVVTTPAVR
jgi:hypothetical protein